MGETKTLSPVSTPEKKDKRLSSPLKKLFRKKSVKTSIDSDVVSLEADSHDETISEISDSQSIDSLLLEKETIKEEKIEEKEQIDLDAIDELVHKEYSLKDRPQQVINWILKMTEKPAISLEKYSDIKTALQKGDTLCQLANKLQPNLIVDFVDFDKKPEEIKNEGENPIEQISGEGEDEKKSRLPETEKPFDKTIAMNNLRTFLNALIAIEAPSDTMFGPADLLSEDDDDDEIKDTLRCLDFLVVWAILKYKLKDLDSLANIKQKKPPKDRSYVLKVKKAGTSSAKKIPKKFAESNYHEGRDGSRSFRTRGGKIIKGLDAELAHKMESKREKGFEEKVLRWVEDVTNISILDEGEDNENYDFLDLDVLHDGKILCILANKIKEGSVTGCNKQDIELAYLENVREYTKALGRIGAPKECQFSPEMLQKKLNLNSVIQSLASLARWCDSQEEIKTPRFEEPKPDLVKSSTTVRAPSKKWAPVITAVSFKRTWKNPSKLSSMSLDCGKQQMEDDDEDYIDPSAVVNHSKFTDRQGNTAYGMDADLLKKLNAKRDPEEEKMVIQWMKDLLGQEYIEYLDYKYSPPKKTVGSGFKPSFQSVQKVQASIQQAEMDELRKKEDFMSIMEDGILLCTFLNCCLRNGLPKSDDTKPAIKNFNTMRNPLAYNANFKMYLQACQEHLGFEQSDCFPIDAVVKGNVSLIVDNIHKVAETIQYDDNYKGPLLVTVERGGKIDITNDQFVPEDSATVLRKRTIKKKEMEDSRAYRNREKTLWGSLVNKIAYAEPADINRRPSMAERKEKKLANKKNNSRPSSVGNIRNAFSKDNPDLKKLDEATKRAANASAAKGLSSSKSSLLLGKKRSKSVCYDKDTKKDNVKNTSEIPIERSAIVKIAVTSLKGTLLFLTLAAVYRHIPDQGATFLMNLSSTVSDYTIFVVYSCCGLFNSVLKSAFDFDLSTRYITPELVSSVESISHGAKTVILENSVSALEFGGVILDWSLATGTLVGQQTYVALGTAAEYAYAGSVTTAEYTYAGSAIAAEYAYAGSVIALDYSIAAGKWSGATIANGANWLYSMAMGN